MFQSGYGVLNPYVALVVYSIRKGGSQVGIIIPRWWGRGVRRRQVQAEIESGPITDLHIAIIMNIIY